jgi:membrane associated rhomboid family serine protease
MPRPISPYRATSSFSFGPGPLSTALKAIIGLNIVMFLLTTFVPALQVQLGLVPQWVVHQLRVYQLVTYMFIHAGLLHLVFNMLTLWMFGTELERMWGTRFFVKFYFISGVGAGALTLLLSLLPIGPLRQLYFSDIVGASGAIFGLLLAYGMYFPERQIYMYLIFPIPARIFVLIMGAITLFLSLSESGGVANATHLCGLLVAYVYLKGARLKLNPWAEVKYRYIKWRINRVRKKFDVYSGGKNDEWNRRVH